MLSSRLNVAVTSSDFFLPTATISALMTDSGATSESTKDAISLFASRRKFAVSYRGDISLSVIAITVAPWSRANSMARTDRVE